MKTPSPRKGPPFVNLLGYDLDGPKRFTVPGAAEGAVFQIRSMDSGRDAAPEFSGTVTGEAGDFSAFRSGGHYQIHVEGHGSSRPFRIQRHALQRHASRLAYQHFIDVRGHVDSAYAPTHITGGGPSRDGGGQTLEAMYELLLYVSNPALFDRWSDELPRRDMPDLVELALWHAEFCHKHHDFSGSAGGYENNIRRFGYEQEPARAFDGQNLLDQLAAVCAAYGTVPGFRQHITRSLYGEYRRVCIENWERYDRHKEVRYWVESDKWIDEGRREFNEQGNAFGQGLLRNLFMWMSEQSIGTPAEKTFFWYDIALAGDAQPEKFLGYAKACAEDIVQNWNFEDPWHSWALRNAEHITPQALGFLLLVAPEHAPEGTREKLRAWADHTLRRSDNLWHYRTHSDTEWSHPKSKEVGTVAGLAGSLFLAAHVLKDERLRELAWSNVNFLFGQNPIGKVLGSATALRIHNHGLWPGIAIEDYWPDSYPQGTGRLGGCRGTFEGSPINAAFPYQPEHYHNPEEPWYSSEGWALTNRAWLGALAFSSLDRTHLRFLDPRTGTPVVEARSGEKILVELLAPIHPDSEEDTIVGIWEHRGGMHEHELLLKQTTADSGVFRTEIDVPLCPGGEWKLFYGAWGLGTQAVLKVPGREKVS